MNRYVDVGLLIRHNGWGQVRLGPFALRALGSGCAPEHAMTARCPTPGARDPDDDRWRYINPDGSPDEGLLGRLTEAIVEAIAPERIILFGSGARRAMHVHSDIDLLVIHAPLGPNRSEQAAALRAALPRDRRAVDIVLATPAEVAEADVDEPYHVVGVALAEGRTIYDRDDARRRRPQPAR